MIGEVLDAFLVVSFATTQIINYYCSCFLFASIYTISGPLLKHIEKKKVFTEREAALVVKDIVSALDFLHKKGA